ncbi:MAG: hypothetical protein AB1689_27145 [Thermodesulfobacteriota bacterium]
MPPDVVAGVTVFLDYPGTRLDLPGTGNASSVLARVTNLTGVTGVFSVGDQDADSDGFDDRLGVGLISSGTAVAPGDFARVVFDCLPGAARPEAADFGCTPDVSTFFGNTISATCAVTSVEVSPAAANAARQMPSNQRLAGSSAAAPRSQRR